MLACICMSVSVIACVPKEPVGRWTPVGDVIEEDLQLVVIVKVCSDDGANRGRHGKLLGRYVLRRKQTHGTSVTHTHKCMHELRIRTQAGVFFSSRGVKNAFSAVKS